MCRDTCFIFRALLAVVAMLGYSCSIGQSQTEERIGIESDSARISKPPRLVLKYSEETATAEAITEVKQFIADRTYATYYQESFDLWRLQDSLGGPINYDDIETVDELLESVMTGNTSVTIDPPISREEYVNSGYLEFDGLLACPISGIQLFSVSVSPGGFMVSEPPSTIIAKNVDSIWFLVECIPNGYYCGDFPIDSGLEVISLLLSEYPLEAIDSTTAVDIAGLAYRLPKLVRWIREPQIFGYGKSDFLDVYFPEFPKDKRVKKESLLPLEEATYPVATKTENGYRVILYYWVNEPAVYRATLQVTKNSLSLVSKKRLGSFGPEMMRID